MGARRFSFVEIKPEEVEIPDIYYAVVRLAVMAAGALAVIFLMR